MVCAHTNRFNVVAKNASHAEGRSVHHNVKHDMVNRPITFSNVGVVPGGLLIKHDVPLWGVQKIAQMMIRHFEHEKMISRKGKEKHNGGKQV